jgi:hypothetical protein
MSTNATMAHQRFYKDVMLFKQTFSVSLSNGKKNFNTFYALMQHIERKEIGARKE